MLRRSRRNQCRDSIKAANRSIKESPGSKASTRPNLKVGIKENLRAAIKESPKEANLQDKSLLVNSKGNHRAARVNLKVESLTASLKVGLTARSLGSLASNGSRKIEPCLSN